MRVWLAYGTCSLMTHVHTTARHLRNMPLPFPCQVATNQNPTGGAIPNHSLRSIVLAGKKEKHAPSRCPPMISDRRAQRSLFMTPKSVRSNAAAPRVCWADYRAPPNVNRFARMQAWPCSARTPGNAASCVLYGMRPQTRLLYFRTTHSRPRRLALW